MDERVRNRGIGAALLEASRLFVLGDVQHEFENAHAVLAEIALERVDLIVAPRDVVLRREPGLREASAPLSHDESEGAVLVDVPELEVREKFINVLDLDRGERGVTVIEVVSPSNKFAGPGRDSYLDKQREVRSSEAHLVEIDLLRAGPHVLAVSEWAVRGRGDYDYLVSVNRAEGRRTRFEVYPRGLRQRLPKIHVPHADGDPDVTLDLQDLVARTHEAERSRRRIDYHQPCVPPLRSDDQAWAEDLGRRSLSEGVRG